jgi:excisionase family DNA binding protein
VVDKMFLSVAEAARETGLCKATIYNLMRDGLPYHLVGRRRLVPTDGLKAFIRGQR